MAPKLYNGESFESVSDGYYEILQPDLRPYKQLRNRQSLRRDFFCGLCILKYIIHTKGKLTRNNTLQMKWYRLHTISVLP